MIQPNNISGTWYTTDGAAAYLGLRADTVRRYAHRGLIRVARRVGICLLFRRADLDAFAAAKRTPGRPKVNAR